MRRAGYLDRNELARTFAWLRPNDMIWNYWVNNYLLGQKPPAFDLLYWNADAMDMPAGPHGDFVDIGVDNPLVRPGGRIVLGSPIDLTKITTDTYVVGGQTDHLTPWPNCYKTTQAAGGRASLRPLHRRPHRGGHQPARQSEGDVPRQRRDAAGRRGMAGGRRDPGGNVVGGLGPVAQ